MVVLQTTTGPTRTPRVGGINAVAQFEEDARVGSTQNIAWISDPCSFPKATVGLCWEEPSFPEDDKTGESIDIVEAIGSPFALYGGVECFLGSDNDFDTRASLILEQGSDRSIETRVAAWAAGATDLPADDLVDALAQVENALDATYVGRGVILVNRGDAVRLHAANALVETLTGVPTTINGTPVIATSSVAAGTVLGTGAIKVLHGPLINHGAPAKRTNVEMWIAERVYVIAVDCSIRVQATVA